MNRRQLRALGIFTATIFLFLRFVPLLYGCVYGCKDVVGATYVLNTTCWAVKVGGEQCIEEVYHPDTVVGRNCINVAGLVNTQANSICAIHCIQKARTPKAADNPIGAWLGIVNQYPKKKCNDGTN